MASWVKEFRDFINRGNVIDLAVAVVLGGAFALVVNSLVQDVITPIIGAIFGQSDFSDLEIDIGDGAIRYGAFLNAVISFVTIAFALFLIVKAYNRFKREKGEDPAGPSQVELLTEIRDALVARRPE